MTAKEKLREQVETLSEKEAERLLAMVERAKERDAIGEAIAEGYRRVPQNSDEDAWAAANAREAIREERW
jgi:endonuclease YncB( thermonuclease family)